MIRDVKQGGSAGEDARMDQPRYAPLFHFINSRHLSDAPGVGRHESRDYLPKVCMIWMDPWMHGWIHI